MKKVGPIALLIFAFALSGCNGGGGGQSAAATKASAEVTEVGEESEPEEAEPTATDSESPSAAETSAPEEPPIEDPKTLAILSEDGFEAELVSKWKETKRIQLKDISESCLEEMEAKASKNSAFTAFNDSEYSFALTSVEAEASFPSTNGFTWPKGWELLLDANPGQPSMVAVCETLNPERLRSPKNDDLSQVSLSPESPKTILSFVEFGRKTPASPGGIDELTDTMYFSVSLNSGDIKCDGNTWGGGEAFCIVPYGLFVLNLPEEMLQTETPSPSAETP